MTKIRHTCGHTAAYELKKPGARRWLEKQSCPQCARAEKRAMVARFERINSLPPLRGTPRQIEWAGEIRARIIHELNLLKAKIPNPIPPGPAQMKARAFLRMLDRARACTSAKAWIERREWHATPEAVNAVISKGEPA